MNNEKPNIELLTEKEKLTAGEDQTIDVLLRITPPAAGTSTKKRPTLNLSMVLDRSGSMRGRKLAEAKEAAKYCIDQLLATDRISAVIFDHDVEVLFPSQPVENKEMLRRATGSVQTAGSTALHEAWVRGGLQVSDHLNNAAINRVLLITDGQANVGETRNDVIVRQAGELKDKGVTTSTIGIGADFNEDLLLPMAESGGGNGWHVQEPQDMVKIFATELQGLVTQIGHSVTLGIKPADGVTIADVLNDFERDAGGRYKLPNLHAGSPLEIVVRLKIAGGAAETTERLAEFDISYVGTSSQLPERVAGFLDVAFASAEIVKDLAANLDLMKAITLLMNARARSEAMDRIDRGDHAGAQMALAAAASLSEIALSDFGSEDEDLRSEVSDLNDIQFSLLSSPSDPMTRKRMAYRRESIRKNK